MSLFILLFTLSTISFAQPPNCTHTISGGSGTRIVGNGQTLCLDAPGTYSGSIVVNSGGNIVVCGGKFTVIGSVTIQPGGKLAYANFMDKS